MTATPTHPGAHTNTGRPTGHWLTITHTYDDGHTTRHVTRSRIHPDHAIRSRITRLRDIGALDAPGVRIVIRPYGLAPSLFDHLTTATTA